MSDDVGQQIRARFAAASADVEREVARLLEAERARLKARAERVERRYDKLTEVAERFRAHERRLHQELDEAESEPERDRLRGMIDGVRYALGEMDGCLR